MALLEIILALAYGSLLEWAAHRYVLHGLGRRRSSFWSFHWHEHHRHSRQGDMLDPDYERSIWGLHAQGKEVLGLLLVALIHAPLLLVAPFFTLTLWLGAIYYYRVHRRSHCDPLWARTHVPWHVDHHLGPKQDMNWGVTQPWTDIVLATRLRYLGTPAAQQDQQRRQARLCVPDERIDAPDRSCRTQEQNPSIDSMERSPGDGRPDADLAG